MQIVFNGKVILGTRARKTCSKSFQAFSSVNYPDLAVLQDEHLLQYITNECGEKPVFYDRLGTNVGLLKLIPGTEKELVAFMAQRYDGLIIESFGVGGVPAGNKGGFYDRIRAACALGKIVAVTTQVQNEGSNLAVYDVGFHLKNDLQLLEAYDMTTEAAVTKLMWALGQTDDLDEVRAMFDRSLAGERAV